MRQRRAITEPEIQFVKDNDDKMSVRNLCEALGRNKGTIDKLRRKLGLRKDWHTPWTNDEYLTLEKNHRLSNKELGEKLGRTASSVSGIRMHRGLRMTRTCVTCGNDFISKYSPAKLCEKCMPGTNAKSDNPLVRYGYYKEGAKSRGLPFDLSEAQFYTFWQKPCTYCGDGIETIGLDRIVPTLGYSLENVTPCCSRCNEMKMSDTTEDWFAHMEKIIQFKENNHGC